MFKLTAAGKLTESAQLLDAADVICISAVLQASLALTQRCQQHMSYGTAPSTTA
jgi:hypothetical protein